MTKEIKKMWVFAKKTNGKTAYVMASHPPKAVTKKTLLKYGVIMPFYSRVSSSKWGYPQAYPTHSLLLTEEMYDFVFPHLRRPNLNELFEVNRGGKVNVWVWTP